MSKEIKIATSPLTNTIYAGTVLKGGRWGAGKQDVTVENYPRGVSVDAPCSVASYSPCLVINRAHNFVHKTRSGIATCHH